VLRPRFRLSREAIPRDVLRHSDRPWRLVLAWVVFILLATTVPFPAGLIETGTFPIDKLVHFGMYAGLGWTVAGAVGVGRGRRIVVLAAWILGVAFAAGDELHQHFIPGRDPALGDWAADAVGFTAAMLASSVRARGRSGREGGGRDGAETAGPSAPEEPAETRDRGGRSGRGGPERDA